MRALIVDDDKANQFILQQFLNPFAKTAVANDGEEGLAMFLKAIESQLPYDLICLDIMMPGIDGAETLRRIRAEEANRGLLGLDGLKVIMISAVADTLTVVNAFRDGCEAYLIKPINRDDLIRNLKVLKLIPDTAGV
ncbi:MAG: response regulator [Deltaproteobacteria bacterium]|nr:response regulator [Deltaproteobacteria bacterium]